MEGDSRRYFLINPLYSFMPVIWGYADQLQIRIGEILIYDEFLFGFRVIDGN